jgi:hypothetical protein
MKTFSIKLTQSLSGYYKGTIEIEASSEKKALEILDSMSNEQIDNVADWTHGDEYDGDIESIEIDRTSIVQI